MQETKILLGFEVGTGDPVYMALHHSFVGGMTQKSGKTTTLEAIISRSKMRAIAFKTKRGETGFNIYNEIPPFFRERADWQYVASILEATMRERMKFERSWIMNASRGAKTLQQVYENVIKAKERARSSLSKNVYTMLEEYLKIVLPQIERTPFTTELNLVDGINVMDLTKLSLEMRSLVIRSVMEYAIDNMTDIIIVVPEAWEYLPQGRNTPVKVYAETFIRKGAAINNFLFVDSQDIAGIDKTPLRQCDNWILGRQREKYEVERVRELIGKKVASERDIRRLKLGHFYAAIGDDLYLTYVLPVGVPEEMGRDVALGKIPPEDVRDYLMGKREDGDEEMYRKKFDEAVETIGRLEDELQALQDEKGDVVGLRLDLEKARKERDDFRETVEKLSKDFKGLQDAHNKVMEHLGRVETQNEELIDKKDKLNDDLMNALEELKAFEDLKLALVKIIGPAIEISEKEVVAPEPGVDLTVTHEAPSLEVTLLRKSLEYDTSTVRGKIIYLYAIGAFGEEQFSVAETNRLLREQGWNQSPRTKQYLDEMLVWGFFSKIPAGKRYVYKVKISPEEAKERGLLKFTEKVI